MSKNGKKDFTGFYFFSVGVKVEQNYSVTLWKWMIDHMLVYNPQIGTLTTQRERFPAESSCGPLESSYKILSPPASRGTGYYLERQHTIWSNLKNCVMD